jgi:hypothetical protein
MAHDRPPRGAHSLGDGGKTNTRKLLLALLGLLLVALLAGVLLSLLIGDDDDDQASRPAATATQAGSATGATPGELSVEGDSLLPVRGSLARYVGAEAEGRGITVQRVAGQQGFWVGTSERDSVYVEFGAKAGETEEGAQYKPKVGDRVNLSGPVRPAPEQPGRTLHVPVSDERVIQRQGVFINADEVRPAR